MDTPFVKRAYNLGLKAVPNFTALPAEVIEYYEKHLAELQVALIRGFVLPTVSEPTEKFALLVDLGTITVPDDYDHATWLLTFKKRHQGGKKKSFYYYNDNITDENFPSPSRILKPGDRLHVRAFQQVVTGTTTSKERMDFCRSQDGNQFTGAQGASLVFDQKRDQLTKGKWYASFDEEDRLWKDVDGDHGVPSVGCDSDGDFKFDLGDLGNVWSEDYAFFCFCDLPAGEAGA